MYEKKLAPEVPNPADPANPLFKGYQVNETEREFWINEKMGYLKPGSDGYPLPYPTRILFLLPVPYPEFFSKFQGSG